MVIVDSLLLATLRACRDAVPSPTAILQQVGAALFESLRKRMHDDQMVSVLLLRHDGGGRVTYSGSVPLCCCTATAPARWKAGGCALRAAVSKAV